MRKEKISRIINSIDEKYTDEATMFALNGDPETTKRRAASEKQSSRSYRVRWAVLAACLAVFIVAGFTATAFAAEAEEYNNAVAFFDENGLSTDGLSRYDIKAVYRDITTNSFTYGKTAEVLRQTVAGWEIEQDEPTPEELEAVWNKNVWNKTIRHEGISYRVNYENDYTSPSVPVHFKKSVLECYEDEKLLWTAEFTNIVVSKYKYTKERTAVWGSEPYNYLGKYHQRIAIIDNSGNVMWKKRIDHGFNSEYVAALLSNGDGTWAMISRGDNYLCLTYYDADGNETMFNKTDIGNRGIFNAAHFGDGFIVHVGSMIYGETASLLKIDHDGNVIDNYSYEADDCQYYLTDMIEFADQIYLSAYAVPIRGNETNRHEISNILEYIKSKYNGEGWDITSEELTPKVQENYTAVLLLCDPEGGAPKTFYSVKGSLGGELSVNDSGQLEWRVENIMTTFFSPATSSFTIGGTCKVFAYTFGTAGNLIGCTDTGETATLRK